MRGDVKDPPQGPKLFAITNFHASNEKGVHSSCFARTPKGNFFDINGLPPTQEVKDLLEHATYNTFPFQELSTTECGQLYLY